MARTFGRLTTSGKIATGTSAKTILQLVAPAANAVMVHSGSISFDGSSPTGGKILVRLLRSASGGSSTSRTPAKMDANDGVSLAASGKENFTGEPTGAVELDRWLVHPQSGVSMSSPVRVKPGETLGFEVTAPSENNAVASFSFEE